MAKRRTFWIGLTWISLLMAACEGLAGQNGDSATKGATEPDNQLTEDFESFAAGETWPDGTVHGDWTSVFAGYGNTTIAADGTQVLSLAPQASTSSSETHAALVTSLSTLGDLDLQVRMKTARQLRTPTPNAWEVAWLLWHYTDNQHFYYLALKPNGWELGKEDPAYPGVQRFLASGADRLFPVGRWYSVRVKQTGSAIDISVDGQSLVTFTDTERPYLSGALGLYTEDAEVHFDDIGPGGAPIMWGVTVDDVSSLSSIVTSLRGLAKRPTTRIVFDEWVPASDYSEAAQQIHQVSDVMGEILDSDAMSQYTLMSDYTERVTDYLDTLGSDVDIWEIGNEINGEWLGTTSSVVAKMTAAYDAVKQRGKRTELTLYYNQDCYDDAQHEMFTWADANVPQSMKQGLDYVLVSYYEDDCNGLQPDWPSVFQKLGAMFPNSYIGFGECGTESANEKSTFIDRYYRMAIDHPRYVGGYFWWYFRQDMVPYTEALWGALNSAIAAGP